jgi:hypothetical protein
MTSKKELRRQLAAQVTANAQLLGRAMDAENKLRDIQDVCTEHNLSTRDIITKITSILDSRPWMEKIREKKELPTIKEYIDQQIEEALKKERNK